MNSTIQQNLVFCEAHPEIPLIEDFSAGNLVCPECGLVAAERVIFEGSEWRTFNDENFKQDPSRVGGPENPFQPNRGLCTTIGFGPGFDNLNAFKDLENLHKRTGCSSDNQLAAALSHIALLARRLNISQDIVSRASFTYKQMNEKRELFRRPYLAKAAACLYIACRQAGVPRTFKEICAVSEVSKKDIGRCFKKLVRELQTQVDTLTTTDFMARFCGYLSLPRNVMQVASHIAEEAVKRDIVAGRSPISVAAAAIYMASHVAEQPREASEIGCVAGVAEMTIRQSYGLMLPFASILMPSNYNTRNGITNLPLA